MDVYMVRNARKDERERTIQDCINQLWYFTDLNPSVGSAEREMQRIFIDRLTAMKATLTKEKSCPHTEGFVYDFDGEKRCKACNKVVGGVKPLDKVDTSKFREKYRWDNICDIANLANALVDAVNELREKVGL